MNVPQSPDELKPQPDTKEAALAITKTIVASAVEVLAAPKDESAHISVWRSACAEIAKLTIEAAKNVLLIAHAVRRAKAAFEELHQNSEMNFAAAMAEETGFHSILVNRYVQIADGLDEATVAAIEHTAIAADMTFLISLVQAEPETRVKALEAYTAVAGPGTPAEKSKKVEAKNAARKVLAENPSPKQKRAAAKRKKKAKNKKTAPLVKEIETAPATAPSVEVPPEPITEVIEVPVSGPSGKGVLFGADLVVEVVRATGRQFGFVVRITATKPGSLISPTLNAAGVAAAE